MFLSRTDGESNVSRKSLHRTHSCDHRPGSALTSGGGNGVAPPPPDPFDVAYRVWQAAPSDESSRLLLREHEERLERQRQRILSPAFVRVSGGAAVECETN